MALAGSWKEPCEERRLEVVVQCHPPGLEELVLPNGVAHLAELRSAHVDLLQFTGLVFLRQPRRIVVVGLFPNGPLLGWDHCDGVYALVAEVVHHPFMDGADLDHEVVVGVLPGELGERCSRAGDPGRPRERFVPMAHDVRAALFMSLDSDDGSHSWSPAGVPGRARNPASPMGLSTSGFGRRETAGDRPTSPLVIWTTFKVVACVIG